MEAGNGIEAVWGHSAKNDKQKRQSPIPGNWRNKKDHYYSGLRRTIIPTGCRTAPEGKLHFF
ncbi:hypothetical protein B5F29_14435 [Lachnoclostridium sp. An196]|jgi:hypothetical protein|nr:hypothetical protein B5F87_10260 [Eubacterium sp. An3]OUP16755.1 hypothetical protein B5F29_14435 [Lachnoclostridium sp. An196]OUP27580.1 hypothetical protein B5F27_09455 [Faecalibacterium sp. An192]OUQ41940.1 hypothetical protein B5E64_16875 [Drancourtella sp. An12]OUQ51743.1 hypothetical protein B5E62_03430 [Lachnoclostridium sp. An118]